MADEPAADTAEGGHAEDRGWEEDAHDRADGDAGPGAVLGGLLPLVDSDGAVDLLDGDAGVVGADHAVDVQAAHELEVGPGLDRVAVDTEEEKYGFVGHLDLLFVA